jgi:integrase/recombinase XerC
MAAEAVANFLMSLEADGRSLKTLETYQWRLGQFLQFLEARKVRELEGIRAEEVDAWAVAMRRQGERYADHPWRPAEGGGLSEATIAGRIQAVKAWLRWCVERGYLERSPARHLRRPKLQHAISGGRRSKAMKAQDLAKMEEIAELKARLGHPRDLALLCFLADTGCRVGELCALRIQDLDLERCEAAVDGKTGPGVVDYGERAAQALQKWLDWRPDLEHDFVFVSLSNDPERRYQPLSEVGVYQMLKRLALLAGVRGAFNPHSIRHLVGQHFTDEGNLELARQKLRHSAISTTADFYAHQDRERLKKATERLSLLHRNGSGGGHD